jgi:hypothetical protein
MSVSRECDRQATRDGEEKIAETHPQKTDRAPTILGGTIGGNESHERIDRIYFAIVTLPTLPPNLLIRWSVLLS